MGRQGTHSLILACAALPLLLLPPPLLLPLALLLLALAAGSERTGGKTVLQKQLERLAVGLFVFAVLLGIVVIAVNKLR